MGDTERARLSAGAMTFLFTDIERSSTWWDRDPAAMRLALQVHDEIIGDVAARTRGHVFYRGGDGFGIAFPTAGAAVRAAQDGQRALAVAAWPETTPLLVRMGLHTGVAEERDGNFFGAAVNRAARVADASHGGQVLLSGVTAALLDPDVALVDQGAYELRGLREPERLWWLPVTGAGPERFPAPRSAPAGQTLRPPLPTRLRFDGDVSFVGRDRSIDQLLTGLQAAREGSAPVLLVSGEPGVGKTRLVAEVCGQLHAGGMTVLYGRCDPHGGAPYQPFGEALSVLADSLDRPAVRTVLAPHGGELTRLVPQLGTLVPGVAEPLDGDAAGDRHRLFSAVTDSLGAVADLTAATVLVIDDAHWADPSTLALLEHLVVTVAPAGLAVVVVYRSTEVPRGTAVEQVIGALRRRSAVSVLHLSGLTLGEVEAYVAEAAPGVGPLDGAGPELFATTQGNPFFVRELVRHLADLRAAADDPSAWSVTSLPGSAVPEGVRDVVRQRLAALPDATVELLEAAAAFGQEFDVRFAARVRGIDVPRALALLEPALESDLVAEAGRGRFTFVHLLVRKTLYDDLPVGRRLDAHVGAARAIESLGDADAHWPELAYHWGEAAVAGHRPEAFASALRAGERSIAAAAHDAAVDHLRSAIGHLADGPVDGVEPMEVRLRLAEALNLAGRLDEAEAELLRVADDARAAGRADLFARAALGIGGDLPSTPPVDAGAIALVEQALAMHPAPSATRALLLCRLAERRHRTLPGAERVALLDEALAIAQGIGDDAFLARVMLSRVRALHGPGAMAEMLEISTEVDRIATVLLDDALAVRSAQVRMNACFVLGDLSGAVQAARVTSVLADRLRQPEYQRLPLMWDAFRAMYEGRFDAATAICDEVRDVLAAGHHSQTTALLGALLMPAWLFHDEFDTCYEVSRDLDVPYRDALLAWFSAETGALDRARHHLQQLGPIARIEADANWSWWQAMVAVASAAALCGDEAVLAEVRDAIAPWADQHATAGLVTYLGSGHHHLGMVEAALGHLDDAVAELQAAIIAHEEIGARPFVAWSQIELARALDRRGAAGDAARAAEARSAALDTASRLGLANVIARA